jgi:energy-coupling factor transporter ATP-binding protein EcfA2
MPALVEALAALHTSLGEVRLPLPTPEAPDARRELAALHGQLEDYVLPRLRTLDAPLLVVVGGSTGAGKSTLVNSLVGADVSRPGVLRPTTRAPVLACAPEDVPWFADARVLPALARTTGDAPDARSLRLVPSTAVPPGLALLDAPDIDSVVTANRELAAQLLSAADLWLFVTTAARYADAVPWDLLHQAAQRSTALAVVLDRVPPDAVADVSTHLAEMLERNGLAGTPLFPVPEVTLADGRLPADVVAPLRAWLDGLAADADRRAAVVRSTLRGALESIPARVGGVAKAADAQAEALERLAAAAHAAYDDALAQVERSVREGSMLRGEVLARWQEYVGTGEFMRNLESSIGRLRDRIRAAFTGRGGADREVRESLETSVEDVVVSAAEGAAERAARAWHGDTAGRALLGADAAALAHCSPDFRERLGVEVRQWQAGVLALVAEEGADKRTAARAASLGVNGAGLAVMLGVFAHTGGLTGGEIVVAGGTSVAAQRVLEALFGDEAVRRLAARARVDLVERVRRLLAAEAERYDAPVAAAGVTDGAGLRRALRDVAAARRDAGW